MAKKALGRGLSNLIPGKSSASSENRVLDNNFRELGLLEIQPDPNQPRKYFDEAELNKLAITLKSVGMIEPVVVRPIENGYQLISGERRWRAAALAGLKKIPAILKQVNDTRAMEMAIIENIQREDLNPVEEARAYVEWMELSGLKANDIAKKVGKDRSTVTNLIRLLKLPSEIHNLIEKKMMNPGQARPLIGIADKNKLHKLSLKIVKENWTARKVEEEVSKIQVGSVSPVKSVKKKDTNIKNLEDKLRRKFTTKINIQHKPTGSGSVSFNYASLDDLDRILALMKFK